VKTRYSLDRSVCVSWHSGRDRAFIARRVISIQCRAPASRIYIRVGLGYGCTGLLVQ
jgi:hypothetical protein